MNNPGNPNSSGNPSALVPGARPSSSSGIGEKEIKSTKIGSVDSSKSNKPNNPNNPEIIKSKSEVSILERNKSFPPGGPALEMSQINTVQTITREPKISKPKHTILAGAGEQQNNSSSILRNNILNYRLSKDTTTMVYLPNNANNHHNLSSQQHQQPFQSFHSFRGSRSNSSFSRQNSNSLNDLNAQKNQNPPRNQSYDSSSFRHRSVERHRSSVSRSPIGSRLSAAQKDSTFSTDSGSGSGNENIRPVYVNTLGVYGGVLARVEQNLIHGQAPPQLFNEVAQVVCIIYLSIYLYLYLLGLLGLLRAIVFQ